MRKAGSGYRLRLPRSSGSHASRLPHAGSSRGWGWVRGLLPCKPQPHSLQRQTRQRAVKVPHVHHAQHDGSPVLLQEDFAPNLWQHAARLSMC
eukprot:365812-Chlamydomonas_euryale.AAC.11